MNNDFKNLVKEVREKNYITPQGDKMFLSYENVQKLEDVGFKINDKIIDRLMDELHDEKFEEASLIKESNNGIINKSLSKIVPFLVTVFLLLSFMMLIYFLVPSFDNKS